MNNDILDFSTTQYLQLSVFVLSMFPVILLFRYYRRTKILDYLLFCLVFVSVMVAQISDFRINIQSSVELAQIIDSTHAFVYLFLFIHALRMKWEEAPRVLWYLGIIWFSVIQFSIIFYEYIELTEDPTVLFTKMRTDKTIPDLYALSTQSGLIIMGNGYRFLFISFRIYVLIIFTYAYLTISELIIYERVKQVKFLWIFASGSVTLNSLLKLGHSLFIWNLPEFIVGDILNLISFLAIAIVSTKYPEGVLLSQVQVIRALSLYKKVNAFNLKEKKEFGMSYLILYLNQLELDNLVQLKEEKTKNDQ